MLSALYINPELSCKRLGIGRATLYTWMNGQMPNLSTMLKVYEVFNINLTLDYMYNFFTIVKHLNTIDNLEESQRYIKISMLDQNDKEFLMEYFKNRYWKSNGQE